MPTAHPMGQAQKQRQLLFKPSHISPKDHKQLGRPTSTKQPQTLHHQSKNTPGHLYAAAPDHIHRPPLRRRRLSSTALAPPHSLMITETLWFSSSNSDQPAAAPNLHPSRKHRQIRGPQTHRPPQRQIRQTNTQHPPPYAVKRE